MLKIKAQSVFEISDPTATEYGTLQSSLLTQAVERAVGELNYVIDESEKGIKPKGLEFLLKEIRGKLQDALNDRSLSNAGFAGRKKNSPSYTYDILNTVINPNVPHKDYAPEIDSIRGK